MRSSRYGLTIHGFALLHFATVLICNALGVNDSLFLTFLSVLMVAILCVRKKLPIEFTALTIVLINIVCFALGVWFAKLAGIVIPSESISHALSTLITTEIVGWGVVWFAEKFAPDDVDSTSEVNRIRQTSWLIAAVAAVFAVRVAITMTINSGGRGEALTAFSAFMGNPTAMLLIVAASIIFLQTYKRSEHNLEYAGKVMVFILFLVVMVLLSALFVAMELPLRFTLSIQGSYFAKLLIVAIITVATIFALVYMIDYALEANNRLKAERERANRASFRYMSLKQQVNPHFLFNSLNVLDALVQSGDKERSSEYIHKLASIYRYMINSENEEFVPLGEELEFSRKFSELLKLRFSKGLEFQVDILDSDLNRYVVPCSLQLLVENATKHNAISEGNPLKIEIFSDGDYLCVRNNIIPRINPVESTGVGLKYIQQQYLNLSGKQPEVEENGTTYTAKLPLL